MSPRGPIAATINLQKQPFYQYMLRLLASYVTDEGYVGPATLSLRQRRRLTHQYISAMLAAGLPPSEPTLQRALDWLIDRSDEGRGGATKGSEHYLVFDKIEASIEMGNAHRDFCRSAVDLLLQRRRSPLDYEVPQENEKHLFTSLWSAKILLHYTSRTDCVAAANETITELATHYETLGARDLALLIALYSQAHRNAPVRSAPLSKMIARLTSLCRSGFFDVKEEMWSRLRDITSSGLTVPVTAGIVGDVYWSLLSTCYVIENLAVLSLRSQPLTDKVRFSADSLYSLLTKAGETYHEVFTPYQQVMLASRALVAFATTTGEDVAKIVIPSLLHDAVRHEKEAATGEAERNKRRLQNVIKAWIGVEWDADGEERLGGGLSGTTIVRLKPKLRIPSDDAEGYDEMTIPSLDSVIVKYGRKAELDRERRSYASIPPEFRQFVATIPSKAHKELIDDEVVEYLVIEDLRKFRTVEELLFPKPTIDFWSYLSDRMVEFLLGFYSMPASHGIAIGATRHMYITPMFQSLERIQTFKQRIDALDDSDRSMLDDVRALTSVAARLDDFPPSAMHGDLNARNVLVSGKHSRNAELRFKLIDLGDFTRSGDLAYDIGEFTADADHLTKKAGHTLSTTLARNVKDAFERFAAERGDEYYGVRFYLARARSLLKIAQIAAKRGLRMIGTDPLSDRNARTIPGEIEPLLLEAASLIRDAACRVVP